MSLCFSVFVKVLCYFDLFVSFIYFIVKHLWFCPFLLHYFLTSNQKQGHIDYMRDRLSLVQEPKPILCMRYMLQRGVFQCCISHTYLLHLHTQSCQIIFYFFEICVPECNIRLSGAVVFRNSACSVNSRSGTLEKNLVFGMLPAQNNIYMFCLYVNLGR